MRFGASLSPFSARSAFVVPPCCQQNSLPGEACRLHCVPFFVVAAHCAANDAPAVAEGQCQATTKSGAPCKRKAQAGGKYCAQHAARMGGGEAEAPAAKPKRTRKAKSEAAPSEAKSEPSAAGMCQGKLKNGEPCKRKAKPGSNFCWQHEK